MNTNRNLTIAVCLAALGWMAPAAAQSIYRCGDSYSQKPCPGGRLVPVDDVRSAAQGRQTTAAAQRDARTAEAMEKARLKEEANPAQAYIPPPRPENPLQEQGRTSGDAKSRKPAHFTAVAPKKPGEPQAKSKKKASKKAG
jgi:hypothetical protein